MRNISGCLFALNRCLIRTASLYKRSMCPLRYIIFMLSLIVLVGCFFWPGEIRPNNETLGKQPGQLRLECSVSSVATPYAA